MNKNSFLESKLIKGQIALVAVLAMVVGFFVSRAMLSVSMMVLGLAGLIGVAPRRWLQQRWWLWGVAWVGLYLLSGLWSHHTDYWYRRCEVKLPVLLLPLAFAFLPAFRRSQQGLFTLFLNLAALLGTCYSLSFLLTNPEHYIKGYDYANILPTLPKGDHKAFSLFLAATIVWNTFFIPFVSERWRRLFLIAASMAWGVMLHVLAARTGLAALYIFLAGWCIFLTLRRSTRLVGVGLLLGFLLSVVLLVATVPTLRNRLDHLNYSLLMFREGNLSGDYGDIGRYMSYDLALKLIRTHPVKGVGAGDLLDSMKAGYDRWYPQVPEDQRLIPHNQFLTVAAVTGIPGLLVFVIWVLYPLCELKRTRAGFFFLITWCMMLIPLFVEPVLEVQFGVFVYLFFLLWQRHAMLREEQGVPGRPGNKTSAA